MRGAEGGAGTAMPHAGVRRWEGAGYNQEGAASHFCTCARPLPPPAGMHDSRAWHAAFLGRHPAMPDRADRSCRGLRWWVKKMWTRARRHACTYACGFPASCRIYVFFTMPG